MKIGKYIVKYQSYGYSYAVPVVYTEQKRRFWFGVKLKQLWVGGRDRPYLCAERMLPATMKKWFEDAVYEYEEYEKAWREYNDKTTQD